MSTQSRGKLSVHENSTEEHEEKRVKRIQQKRLERFRLLQAKADEERMAKEAIQSFIDAYSDPIVTTIEPALNLVVAEVYHHDYYARNPNQGYCQMVVGPKLSKVRKKLSHLYQQTD